MEELSPMGMLLQNIPFLIQTEENVMALPDNTNQPE